MSSCQHTHILSLSCQGLCISSCQELCVHFPASLEDSTLVLALIECHSNFQHQTCSQQTSDIVLLHCFITLAETRKKVYVCAASAHSCTICHLSANNRLVSMFHCLAPTIGRLRPCSYAMLPASSRCTHRRKNGRLNTRELVRYQNKICNNNRPKTR